MDINSAKIIEIINESIDSDRQDYDLSTPLNQQGIDSLDLMTAFMLIEEKYGVKVSDEHMEKLNSIEDIVNFLNENA